MFGFKKRISDRLLKVEEKTYIASLDNWLGNSTISWPKSGKEFDIIRDFLSYPWACKHTAEVKYEGHMYSFHRLHVYLYFQLENEKKDCRHLYRTVLIDNQREDNMPCGMKKKGKSKRKGKK